MMRTLIAITFPNWPTRRHSGRENQAAQNELSAALRILADRIQNCGVGGGDVVIDRPSGLTATMRVEIERATADAA